jgi:hypothetical protein
VTHGNQIPGNIEENITPEVDKLPIGNQSLAKTQSTSMKEVALDNTVVTGPSADAITVNDLHDGSELLTICNNECEWKDDENGSEPKPLKSWINPHNAKRVQEDAQCSGQQTSHNRSNKTGRQRNCGSLV